MSFIVILQKKWESHRPLGKWIPGGVLIKAIMKMAGIGASQVLKILLEGFPKCSWERLGNPPVSLVS